MKALQLQPLAIQVRPVRAAQVDIAISDDMLCCLDALSRGGAGLHTLVSDGEARARAVIESWGLRWPEGA